MGAAKRVAIVAIVVALLVVSTFSLSGGQRSQAWVRDSPSSLHTFGYVNSLTAEESSYCLKSAGYANVSDNERSNLTVTFTNLTAATSPSACTSASPHFGVVIQTTDGSTLLNMILYEINNTTTPANHSAGFFRYVVNSIPIYSTSIATEVDAFWEEQNFGFPPELRYANCGPECGGDGGGGSATTSGSGVYNSGCSQTATSSSGVLGSALSENQCLTAYLITYLQGTANTNQAYQVLSILLAGLLGALCTVLCAIAAALLLSEGWWLVQWIDAVGSNNGIYEGSCNTGLLFFLTVFCASYTTSYQWVWANPVPSGF
jgi:hypothetical protein